jgi:hypothetical protein
LTAVAEFVAEMKAAMLAYLGMRREGVSREDACQGVEAVLRGSWSKPVTKFPPRCDLCDDSGWLFRTCTDGMRCRRESCHKKHPASEHSYVEKCGCVAGDTR